MVVTLSPAARSMPVSSQGFWFEGTRTKSECRTVPARARASRSSNFKRNALFSAVDGACMDSSSPKLPFDGQGNQLPSHGPWRAHTFGPTAADYLAHPAPDLHEPAMRQFHPFHSQLYLGKGRALYCGPLQHLEAHAYGAPSSMSASTARSR
jgi:hypothetical protein